MSYCCNIKDLPFYLDDPQLEEKIKRKFTMEGVIPDIRINKNEHCWVYLDLDKEENQRFELESIRGLIDFESFEEAGKELESYRSSYPFETNGMYEEAHLAYAQGCVDDALSLCLAIIDYAPRHADTLALAGNILWSKGNIDQAKEYYKRVAEIDAHEAQSYIRDLLRDHRCEQAIFLSEQCLEQEEQTAYFHLLVARCYRALKQYNEALQWALKGLRQTKSKSFANHGSIGVLLRDMIDEMSVEIVTERQLRSQLKKKMSDIQKLTTAPVRIRIDKSLIPFTISTMHIPNALRSFYMVGFEEFDNALGYSSALEQLLRLQLSLQNDDGDLRQLDYDLSMNAAYNKLFPSDTIGKRWTEDIDGLGEINVIDTGDRQSEISEIHDMLMLCTIGLHLNERIYNEYPDFRTSQYLYLTKDLSLLVEELSDRRSQSLHVACTKTIAAIYAKFINRLYGYCDLAGINEDDEVAESYLKYYEDHRPTEITDYYSLIEFLGEQLGVQSLIKWESTKWFLPLFHKIL